MSNLATETSFQIRGLLLLLCTRSLNKAHAQVPINFDSGDFGITPKQRKLAEYVEMIYTAQGMHRSVLNLPIGFHDVSMLTGELQKSMHVYRYDLLRSQTQS